MSFEAADIDDVELSAVATEKDVDSVTEDADDAVLATFDCVMDVPDADKTETEVFEVDAINLYDT